MRIPFAWSPRLERYVSPQEVERGLKCGCICHDCSQNVICKQGKKKSWHFAHQSNSDCRGEGMVHRLAKDVLKQSVGKKILRLGLREIDSATICKVDLEVQMPKADKRIDAGVALQLPNGNTQKIVLEVCVSNPKCKAYIRDMSTAYKRTPILELIVDPSHFLGQHPYSTQCRSYCWKTKTIPVLGSGCINGSIIYQIGYVQNVGRESDQ